MKHIGDIIDTIDCKAIKVACHMADKSVGRFIAAVAADFIVGVAEISKLPAYRQGHRSPREAFRLAYRQMREMRGISNMRIPQ